MWDKNTSINEPEVIEIKKFLIEKGIVDASAFEIQKNFDVSSGATHYPIVFIVDVSESLRNQRKALNNAIHNFVKDILESRTTLSSSIDFSIITFSSKVVVKRPFAYITEVDVRNNSQKCSISEDEIQGMTNMGSALFVSWYLAESRKLMYKDSGVDYKQPIFVLISDLRNNERTKIGEDYLVTKIITLYNIKYAEHKLGLLKALFGRVSKSYDELLNGTIIDAPTGFADMLNRLFVLLVSTIAANEDPDRYLTSDEDDGVFLVYNGLSNDGKSNLFTSDKLKVLLDLFDDDDDE